MTQIGSELQSSMLQTTKQPASRCNSAQHTETYIGEGLRNHAIPLAVRAPWLAHPDLVKTR